MRPSNGYPISRTLSAYLGLAFFLSLNGWAASTIQTVESVEANLRLTATLSGDADVLTVRQAKQLAQPGETLLSVPIPSGAIDAVLTIPRPAQTTFFIVETRTGTAPTGTLAPSDHVRFTLADPTVVPMDPELRPYHTLNRLGYGPNQAGLDWIQREGVESYIKAQLSPSTIEETDDRLSTALQGLLRNYRPGQDIRLTPDDGIIHFFKGSSAPPTEWAELNFKPEDPDWLLGKMPIGRAQAGLATELNDMRLVNRQRGYVSVFLRLEFDIATPEAHKDLIFRTVYDDGFIAYVNGNEIARANLQGSPPNHNTTASSRIATPYWREFSFGAQRARLKPGRNVLAIQFHNYQRNDADSYMDASLLSRSFEPESERLEIKDITNLQDLLHIRGIYSQRQLQAVMGEFWENHFTTDYDKVADYLNNLRDLDGRDLFPRNYAEGQAAQIEFTEYEFFYQNALGNFSDLLLYSATSPAQLIYLDNVLNRVGEANENYAREILELFAFGVDNRYTQTDIEELSRAFTGWQVRKVRPQDHQPFPNSARSPSTADSLEPVYTPLIDSGADWKFYRGNRDPSLSGRIDTQSWTARSFDDSRWRNRPTPFGYDLENENVRNRLGTVLDDMPDGYASFFLRRDFQIESTDQLENLFLLMDYDDGYVAYLNGLEIRRSESMRRAGRNPSHRVRAEQKRLATAPTEIIDLTRHIRRLRLAPQQNVLAIQIHNSDIADSNSYANVRLATRSQGPGSIAVNDPNGIWTFRFNPEDHDFSPKILFEGTPHEITIPGDRQGKDGVIDALTVIDKMVEHPSTAEFICLKLINRFVSDEISLNGYHQRTASPHLLQTMDAAIAAWQATVPQGQITHVLHAIFSSPADQGAFWSKATYQAKVKTPIEYVNGIVRALDWQIRLNRLPDATDGMGMHFFTRNDPDGWSEKGFDWMNTGGLQKRLNFSGGIPRLGISDYLSRWHIRRFLEQHNLVTDGDVIEHFNHLLFANQMTPAEKNVFRQFANTRTDGSRVGFRPTRSDYLERAGDLVGLILSSPELQFQ